MRPLDTTTCTMRDVIARSALCYPSLFCECLADAERVHWRYSVTSQDRTAARIAGGMANDLRRVLDAIRMGNLDVDGLTHAEVKLAYAPAARLQMLPHHVKTEIAGRGYGPAAAFASA